MHLDVQFRQKSNCYMVVFDNKFIDDHKLVRNVLAESERRIFHSIFRLVEAGFDEFGEFTSQLRHLLSWCFVVLVRFELLVW